MSKIIMAWDKDKKNIVKCCIYLRSEKQLDFISRNYSNKIAELILIENFIILLKKSTMFVFLFNIILFHDDLAMRFF